MCPLQAVTLASLQEDPVVGSQVRRHQPFTYILIVINWHSYGINS